MSRFLSMAGQQIAELAELAAESGRLSRGRKLFRKGSVTELSIIEGAVLASVRGSEGDLYETTVGTAPAPPGVVRQIAHALEADSEQSIDDLIAEGLKVCPTEVDLAFGCDCADWEEPCKHVVAVLLALADRVDLDETELLRWRSVDPQVTSTAPPADTSPDTSDDRSTKLSELEALLGDTALRVPVSDRSKPQLVESAPPLEPAMAEFLGVDMTIEPVDTSEITAPALLFADVQLGPLADLGPELADAIATIASQLEKLSPE